jgi:hypothetical protein
MRRLCVLALLLAVLSGCRSDPPPKVVPVTKDRIPPAPPKK